MGLGGSTGLGANGHHPGQVSSPPPCTGVGADFPGSRGAQQILPGAWHPVVWPLPLAQTLPQPCPFLPGLSLGSRLWDQSLLLMLEDAVIVACAHGVTVNGA